MPSYKWAIQISFEGTVKDSVPSPDVLNPLLEAFKRQLLHLRILEPGLTAQCILVDDFIHEERGRRALFSLQLEFQVNSDYLIQEFVPILCRKLMEQKLRRGGVELTVLDTSTGRDCKDHNLWPTEKF